MIAVVTSTLFPPETPCYDGARSRFSPLERLDQTRGSVGALAALGFRRIVVADNSVRWDPAAAAALAPAEVLRFATPDFRNKGLAELHLLRAALAELPPAEPVVKLSGRYLLTRNLLDDLGPADFAARSDNFRTRQGAISTRAYACRDVARLQQLVARAIDEAFAYPARIVGPRSLWRIIRHSWAPERDAFPYADPPHSIEFIVARTLKLLRYDVRLVARLGVRGTMAGTGAPIDE